MTPLDPIKKEHVEKAFQKINQEGTPTHRRSITTYILKDEKKYPAKYVISLAYGYATGNDLAPEEFVTTSAKNYLKKLGYEIIGEKEPTPFPKPPIKNEENTMNFEQLQRKGLIEFITFHPSYSYEEFVEGITIDLKNQQKTDSLHYILKIGIFKKMVIRALALALDKQLKDENEKFIEYQLSNLLKEYRETLKNQEITTQQQTEEWWKDKKRAILIIDEINRGDISKIFGELITLLENDKRLGMKNQLIVRLPYSQEEFCIPPNLYIIGTMNTADKSIALIDVALRRRFGFIEKSPDFSILQTEYLEKNKEQLTEEKVYDGLQDSIQAIQEINKRICQDPTVGRDKQIGHSFFFNVKTQTDLIMVWQNEILPLLEEYYYGQYKRINKLLFKNEEETQWITETQGVQKIQSYSSLFEMINQIKKSD